MPLPVKRSPRAVPLAPETLEQSHQHRASHEAHDRRHLRVHDETEKQHIFSSKKSFGFAICAPLKNYKKRERKKKTYPTLILSK